MFIQTYIDEFRQQNGKLPVSNWESSLNDNCYLHCLEMVRRGYCFHSEEYYRPGLGELVADGIVDHNLPTTFRCIIGVFSQSMLGHREALLNWNTMAYGFCTDKGKIYVTIRGR